jgi:hypothetical protein
VLLDNGSTEELETREETETNVLEIPRLAAEDELAELENTLGACVEDDTTMDAAESTLVLEAALKALLDAPFEAPTLEVMDRLAGREVEVGSAAFEVVGAATILVVAAEELLKAGLDVVGAAKLAAELLSSAELEGAAKASELVALGDAVPKVEAVLKL